MRPLQVFPVVTGKWSLVDYSELRTGRELPHFHIRVTSRPPQRLVFNVWLHRRMNEPVFYSEPTVNEVSVVLVGVLLRPGLSRSRLLLQVVCMHAIG